MDLSGTEILFFIKPFFVDNRCKRTLPINEIIDPQLFSIGHQDVQFSVAYLQLGDILVFLDELLNFDGAVNSHLKEAGLFLNY